MRCLYFPQGWFLKQPQFVSGINVGIIVGGLLVDGSAGEIEPTDKASDKSQTIQLLGWNQYIKTFQDHQPFGWKVLSFDHTHTLVLDPTSYVNLILKILKNLHNFMF